MMNAVRKMLVLFFAGLSTAAFAADSYYWVDSGDHDLMKRENWRFGSVSGSLPEKWPPTLDTATSGSTHPQIYVRTSATLELPNDDSITLNDLIFDQGETDSTIDIGSKTLKLFGCGLGTVLWVGGNSPNGVHVRLKSGTIVNAAASQRSFAVLLGNTATTDKKMSGFYIDGQSSIVSNLLIDIRSPMCEYVVTNGGKAYLGGANYAVQMKQGNKGSAVRVSGKGSVLNHLTRANMCFHFGNVLTNPDATSGGLEITDGGVVTNASGNIGVKAGNFYVKMDNGTWEGPSVALGSDTGGTSTNNSFVARNGSRLVFTTDLSIGYWGGLNRALVESSDLVTPSVYLGRRGDGAGHNSMIISNSTFNVSAFYVGGGTGNGLNANNNTLEIRASTSTAETCDINVSNRTGGGATNHLVLADSDYAFRNINLGVKHGGHNTALVTNCTFAANFTIGGSSGSDASASDCNTALIVDSTLGTPTKLQTAFSFAESYVGYPSRSNRLEFVRSTWYNKNTYFAVGGWNGNTRGNDGNVMTIDDHSLIVCTNGTDGVAIGRRGFGNRLEIRNASTLYTSDTLALGSLSPDFVYAGTNVVFVGKDAEVFVTGYLATYPGGNAIVIDDGSLSARYMRLHYFYSAKQGRSEDGMAAAEEEYGKTAKEIWGTRFVFRGSHPVFTCPGEISTISVSTGCIFDRSCIVSFEFPEEPYANPPLQSSLGVTIGDGTTVEFDLSKVGIAGGKYVLADLTEAGDLTVSATQLAAMQEELTAAATAVGRKARIFVDGKKLVVKVSSNFGMLLIVR